MALQPNPASPSWLLVVAMFVTLLGVTRAHAQPDVQRSLDALRRQVHEQQALIERQSKHERA